jgi:hypothetical protein
LARKNERWTNGVWGWRGGGSYAGSPESGDKPSACRGTIEPFIDENSQNEKTKMGAARSGRSTLKIARSAFFNRYVAAREHVRAFRVMFGA